MINEVIEANTYLNGEYLNKKNLFRICYMLAKWFKEQGQTHIEIRDSIFNWAKKYNLFIPYNLNNIIYQALDDKQRLKDNVVVKINEKDTQEINKRFDNKNTKLVALAMLCYAKAFADRDKEFSLSSVALSAWLDMNDSNLRNIYIRELIDFGYITKVENTQNTHSWNKKKSSKTQKYKMLADLHNSGETQIMENDIKSLFEKLF